LISADIAEDNVIELSLSTFETLVEQRESDQFFLVEFYNPHCGACKNFMPAYSQLADYLKGIIKVGRLGVDKEENSAIYKKYNVGGVPYIILFKAGIPLPVEYDVSPRTLENIVKWIISHLERTIKITAIKDFLPRPTMSDPVPNQYIILYERTLPMEYCDGLISEWGKKILLLQHSVDKDSMQYLRDYNITSYPSILTWNPNSKVYKTATTALEVEDLIQEQEIEFSTNLQFPDVPSTLNLKLYLLYCLLTVIGAISLYVLLNKPKQVEKPLIEVKTSKFN